MSVSAPSPNAHSVDDATVRAAVAVANVPTLLMVLVQLTGDLRWLEPPSHPRVPRAWPTTTPAGCPSRFRPRSVTLPPMPSSRGATAARSPWRRRTRAVGPDARRLHGRGRAGGVRRGVRRGARLRHRDREPTAPLEVPAGFSVVIIGAGISGVAAAVKLRDARHPVRDRRARRGNVGGVWRENALPRRRGRHPEPSLLVLLRHPGLDAVLRDARRDRHATSTTWSTPTICAGTSGSSTEVQRADVRRSDRTAGTSTCGPRTDAPRSCAANVVISCAGAFNPPDRPADPRARHASPDRSSTPRSGRPTLDAHGQAGGRRRQRCQRDAGRARDRPRRGHADGVPAFPAVGAALRQVPPGRARAACGCLFEEVPLYRAWYRLRLGWTFHDKLYDALQTRPGLGRSRALDQRRRTSGTASTSPTTSATEIGDREELLDKVIPTYPPFGKRMLHGQRMVPDAAAAERRTGHGQRDRGHGPTASSPTDGRQHDADVLVLRDRVRRRALRVHLRGASVATGRDAAGGVGRRRLPGLPRPRGPGLPQLLHPLRPQHPDRARRELHLRRRDADALHHGSSAEMVETGLGAAEVRRGRLRPSTTDTVRWQHENDDLDASGDDHLLPQRARPGRRDQPLP